MEKAGGGSMSMNERIHQGQSVAMAGVLLNNAEAAMVITHGRGGTNHQALALVDHIGMDGFAYLAPQAYQNSWYPHSFMAPMESNQPYLDSALQAIDDAVTQIIDAGIATEKIMLLGFSQGACLSLEYVARNAKRFGGVVGLSGGLIGPEGTPRDYAGSLDGTPVFLGCSDVDFHIPLARVHESAQVLKELGGDVEERIYEGMGHTINNDELDYVRHMMAKVVAE